MDQDALRAAARAGALFADLPENVASTLLDAATIRQVAPDTALFHQGDAPMHLLQIVSGLVRLAQINPDGLQTTLRIMRPGDLLGCVAVFQQFPYPATATALDDTLVLCWRSGQFLELMGRHPGIVNNALRVVGMRARDMVQRVVEMSGRRVEQRVAAALLRLAGQAGMPTDDGICIEYPVTRDDLAEMAGLTYFTISRALSKWQKKGVLKSGRQRMTILDRERLAHIAEGRDA